MNHGLYETLTMGFTKRAVLTFLAVSGLIGLAGFRVWQWTTDPRFCMLTHESEARWIRAGQPFPLQSTFEKDRRATHFLHEFSLSGPASGSVIRIHAFRQFQLWLDSPDSRADPLFEHTRTEGRSWNAPVDVRLPDLSSGPHRILISVTNEGAPPCLMVSSPELGVFTGRHWKATGSLWGWADAADLDDPPVNMQDWFDEKGYPTTFVSIRRVWPWLAIVFGLSFAWTEASFRRANSVRSWVPDRLSASGVRWILVGAWWLLATTNIGSVPTRMGFNWRHHLEYVEYLIENHRIPLASDGWQMFQSPLQYLLAAPLYRFASHHLSPDECAKLLRVFPLLCGMAQIEIIFRSARLVFPTDDDRQVVALLVGGLMPMNLCMSQVFCNEPLAAFLTAVVVLHCLSLLRSTGELQGVPLFGRLGLVWGLALLAKVTPILLAPLIVLTIVCHGVQRNSALLWHVHSLGATLGTCLVVCGWYYGRNWVLMGSPFIGGADPSRGIVWSQEPGYRTWHQLTSFGRAMVQPVYAGAIGFWDGIYASMWSDGQLSGTSFSARQIPWNVDFLQVGPWTAVIPMGCLVLGFIMGWRRDLQSARGQICFAVAAIGIYFAAILDQFVSIPIFGVAKSSYALGLLPCFGLIAAAGAGVFLRHRLLRALLFGGLFTWAFAAYSAFFCVK